MTYKHLFFISTTLNIALIIATWLDKTPKEQQKIRWVDNCKTCKRFNFRDLEEAQKEFTKVKLQKWYKEQVEDRNRMIRRAIMEGYWTPGCTVPPILTEEAKLIPGFAELFDSAK